jgi:hypothetical protein
MGARLEITRTEHTGAQLRGLSNRCSDGAQVRRILALAMILEGRARIWRRLGPVAVKLLPVPCRSLRRGGRRRFGDIALARDHQLPGDAGHLVGQRHGGQLRRLALETLGEPGLGLAAALSPMDYAGEPISLASISSIGACSCAYSVAWAANSSRAATGSLASAWSSSSSGSR